MGPVVNRRADKGMKMTYTKESIYSRIGELLLEINDDYTALSSVETENSDQALLLLEAKVNFLVSHVSVLRTLTDANRKRIQQTAEENSVVIAPEKEVHHRDSKHPIPQGVVVADVPKVLEDPVLVPVQTTIQGTPDWGGEEEEELVSEVRSTPVEEEQQVPAATAQTVEGEHSEMVLEPSQQEEEKPTRPLTLNEILKQQRSSTRGETVTSVVTGTVNTSPAKGNADKVNDLKTAISLNDKLVFIRELFNGYSLAYSEAIELLNRYTTFAEADAFLQTNYALKNNWADKPQTVEKLYAILRRKFML